MDICRFPSSVESSNCDPYPETKQGPYWPINLQAYCTNQLPVQSPGTHDKHSLHLVSWKIWYTRQKPVWFQKASQHNGTPGESRKVRRGCLCAEAASSRRLLWFRKGLWDNPARWYHTWPAQDWAEADCLFSCQNISGIAEFESESGPHSLMNSTQRKVSQLVMSWLWHVLDWRLISCPLVLPNTSSEHSLWMTWRSVSVDAPWTP